MNLKATFCSLQMLMGHMVYSSLEDCPIYAPTVSGTQPALHANCCSLHASFCEGTSWCPEKNGGKLW
jgi:hypothetical protein